MENKTKTLIVTNILTAILVLALGGYIIFDNVTNKDATKEDDNKLVENNNDKEEQKENEKNSKDSLFYSTADEDYKIYLTEDKTVKLVSTSLGNKEIASNITWIRKISAGQSDICEGNTWLILSASDGKYTALSVDDLSCGNKISTIDLSAELSKKNIKDVVSIFETVEYVNQYEPLSHKVFGVDKNGKTVEITDLFVRAE